jgi:predicted dehydrogenase
LPDTDLRTVLLLGCGEIARRVHLPFVTTHEHVASVFVYDKDAARAERVAEEFGCIQVDDPFSVDADVAIICTPPDTHAALIERAIQHGMDVVCEKPLATTAGDAKRVQRAQERSGRLVHLCYTNRYRSDVIAMHRLLQSGGVGDLRRINVSWARTRGVPGTDATRESGVLVDLGSHMVDLALWLTGWRGAVTAFAVAVRNARDAGTSQWYGRDGMDVSGPAFRAERSIESAVAMAKFGDRVLQLSVSWNDETAGDSVSVEAFGDTGVCDLRTVFGFSPDRVLRNDAPLRISRPDERT